MQHFSSASNQVILLNEKRKKILHIYIHSEKEQNPSKLVIVMTSQTRVRSETIHSVHGKEMLKEIRSFLHIFTFFTVRFVISSFMNYPKWCWIHTHAHVSRAVRATFFSQFSQNYTYWTLKIFLKLAMAIAKITAKKCEWK